MTITLNTPTGRRGQMITRNHAEHARLEVQRKVNGVRLVRLDL